MADKAADIHTLPEKALCPSEDGAQGTQDARGEAEVGCEQ